MSLHLPLGNVAVKGQPLFAHLSPKLNTVHIWREREGLSELRGVWEGVAATVLEPRFLLTFPPHWQNVCFPVASVLPRLTAAPFIRVDGISVSGMQRTLFQECFALHLPFSFSLQMTTIKKGK